MKDFPLHGCLGEEATVSRTSNGHSIGNTARWKGPGMQLNPWNWINMWLSETSWKPWSLSRSLRQRSPRSASAERGCYRPSSRLQAPESVHFCFCTSSSVLFTKPECHTLTLNTQGSDLLLPPDHILHSSSPAGLREMTSGTLCEALLDNTTLQ